MSDIRWGIIGLGNIARSFANDFAYTNNGRIVAAASRDIAKAKAFCTEFDIEKAYGSYSELFKDPEIDAIYIATPHNLHFQNSVEAIKSGKAVLCEKPITTNPKDLIELQKLASSSNNYLMEAMWTYFLPPIRKMKQWIDEGKIGSILSVKADFAFKAEYNPESRLFDPALAGGALLDIGIYPIAFALLVINSEPSNIHVISKKAPTGVDMGETMVFEYENGVTAHLYASLDHNMPNDALVIGSEGYISIPDFFKCKECKLYQDGNLVDKYVDDRTTTGYNYEINAVHQDLLAGNKESSIIPLSASLRLQRIMEEVKSKIYG